MAVRRIVYCGDPVLRRAARRVREIDDEVVELIRDLRETMLANSGLGLAAVQVGVPLAVAVVRPDLEGGEPIALINPEIAEEDGREEGKEGCLSLPTLSGIVVRPQRVLVSAMNVDGEEIEVEGEDLMARCLVHEFDHLRGTLFIDRVEPDSLYWMRPDEREESGYRMEETTIEEAEAAFERLRAQREDTG